MTSSDQQITRCPKCGTAFRITRTQLQSAKGAVRCGSCLNVFKALDYLVTPPQPKVATGAGKASTTSESNSAAAAKPSSAGSTAPSTEKKATPLASTQSAAHTVPVTTKSIPTNAPVQTQAGEPPKAPEQLAILSSIKPLPVNPAPVAAPQPQPRAEPRKPVVRVLDKSSLDNIDDILISDDMEDAKSETKSYEFDGFLDIDVKPKADVSLFERKIRDEDEKELQGADESWAEMLIEEDDEEPEFRKQRSPIIDDEEADFHATSIPSGPSLSDSEIYQDQPVMKPQASPSPVPPPSPSQSSPSLVFSLVGEVENDKNPPIVDQPTRATRDDDDLVLSDELAKIPDHTGFKPAPASSNEEVPADIFEVPDAAADELAKRHVKTQPKIRSYDGSRTALLMNIMPAPIEFTAKRMRRWYQRKLWPALSLLAMIALVIQLAWFKFDYFSRVEPYRTAYTFICPYVGCNVPTLVDTRQINAFNLVVREHPETAGALAVDVMIVNNAPFDQPYPDLVLMFTDLDENEVASRRFTPGEYLGGEAAGSSLMPQRQPVHLTLDLVDPGESAVNYHIYIPQK